jgi:hypothetical protein
MIDFIDINLLKFLWYGILALVALIVLLGRADIFIRVSMGILMAGYMFLIITQDTANTGWGHFIVRVGYTALLFRLAVRRGTENIE